MASDFDDLDRPAQRRTESSPDERDSLPVAPPQKPDDTDEFGTRIDQLVSSALEDQAREKREITDTVSSARDALEHTQQELHSLRGRIDPLERAIVDLAELISGIPAPIRRSIEDSASAISQASRAPLEELNEKVQALSDQVGAIGAALAEELGAAITETSTLAVGDMRESIQSSREMLDERVGSLEKALEELSRSNEAAVREASESNEASVGELSEAVNAQGVEIGAVVGRAVASLSEKLDKLADRTRRAELRITESNARLEAMQESLVSYLASRDDRLERVRDTILENLIEEFASSLKHRDRVRLAVSLREAEQRRRDHRDAERYRKLRGASSGPREDDVAETRRALEGTPRAAAGGAPAVSARMIASGAATPTGDQRRAKGQTPAATGPGPSGPARAASAERGSDEKRERKANPATQGDSNGQTQEGSRLGASAKRLASAERASAPPITSPARPGANGSGGARKSAAKKSSAKATGKRSTTKKASKKKASSKATTATKSKSTPAKPKTSSGNSAATRASSRKKSAGRREGAARQPQSQRRRPGLTIEQGETRPPLVPERAPDQRRAEVTPESRRGGGEGPEPS